MCWQGVVAKCGRYGQRERLARRGGCGEDLKDETLAGRLERENAVVEVDLRRGDQCRSRGHSDEVGLGDVRASAEVGSQPGARARRVGLANALSGDEGVDLATEGKDGEKCGSLTKVDWFVNENHRVPIPEFSSRCLPICPERPDESRFAPAVSRREYLLVPCEYLLVPFRPRFFSPSPLFQYFQRDSRWIPMEYPDGFPDVYLWVPMVHLPIEYPDASLCVPLTGSST